MTTDPIADMLTRVRNAVAADHNSVAVPASRMKADIAKLLAEEGYVESFDVSGDGTRLLMERGRTTSNAVLIRDLR